MSIQNRLQQMLAALHRRYPNAWERMEMFHAEKGLFGETWPDWCWCPLAGAHAVATNGANSLQAVGDVAFIGALASWRVGQGIYRLHPALVDAFLETPLDEVPAEYLHQLPEWCVFVELDGGGFFAHLEYDVNTGREELRFLLVPPGNREPFPMILHLGYPTLEEGCQAVLEEIRRNAARFAGLDLSLFGVTPHGVEEYHEEQCRLIRLMTNIVVYIISAVQEGDALNRRGGLERPSRRERTANHPSFWEVGWRQGEAYMSALQASGAPLGGSHASPRPHLRRAHWHTFLCGARAGERVRRVQWVPPIVVAGRSVVPVIRDIGSPGFMEVSV